MKTLHPTSSCIALLFLIACSDRGSEQPEREARHDEASAEMRPAQPQSEESSPTSSPSVRDKLTCPSGCVKISTTAPSPACCNCNGQARTWKRSTWSPTTWLCQ